MHPSTSLYKANSFIIGSVLIGDISECPKVECFVGGIVNAVRFIREYPSLGFYQRKKLGQRILDAANVGEKVLLTSSWSYFFGFRAWYWFWKHFLSIILGRTTWSITVGMFRDLLRYFSVSLLYSYFRSQVILERFYLMLKMESNMWILSTLGGGFSSLAECGLQECVGSPRPTDTFYLQAKTALSISERQLKLAKQIGDDVLHVRCYVYIGFALAQLRQFDQALRVLL